MSENNENCENRVRFCSKCGSPTKFIIPSGDNRPRDVCSNQNCQLIHYQNPKIVVGCLVIHKDKILLCRRAIEPGYGLWTIPAGFMENLESASEGALRETLEESGMSVQIKQLFSLISLPSHSQIYLMYLAESANENIPNFIGTPIEEETLEAKFFAESEIPYEDFAFISVVESIQDYFRQRNQKQQQNIDVHNSYYEIFEKTQNGETELNCQKNKKK